MNELLPVLVTEPEFGGWAVLEIEVDPLHSAVDASADACGCEVGRVGCLTGLFSSLGRGECAIGRCRRSFRTRAEPLTDRQPGFLFPVNDRLDHSEVRIAAEPCAVALFLGREVELSGVGTADLPAANGGGFEGLEDPLAGLRGGSCLGVNRIEAIDSKGDGDPAIEFVRRRAYSRPCRASI